MKPTKRDLTYEENNARVVWNSLRQEYMDRPCHGVRDPGAMQMQRIREVWSRRLAFIAALAFVGWFFFFRH